MSHRLPTSRGFPLAVQRNFDFLADQIVQQGHGSPENEIIAHPGALYVDLDGGVGATLFVKETGSGNTGWAAK